MEVFKGYRSGPDAEAARERGDTFAVIVPCSGNVRPFMAEVFIDGRWRASTGFCKTEGRALEAARILARDVKPAEVLP